MDTYGRSYTKEACIVASEFARHPDQFALDLEEDCLFITAYNEWRDKKTDHFVIAVQLNDVGLKSEDIDMGYAKMTVRGRAADPRGIKDEVVTPTEIVMTVTADKMRIDSRDYLEFWVELYFKRGG